MTPVTLLFLALAATLAGLTLARVGLAAAEIRRQSRTRPAPVAENDITVLQPILGGDPALAQCLEHTLREASRARVIWLLDDDDPPGQQAARQALAASGRDDVILLFTPPPPADRNPKIFKLIQGLDQVKTPFVAILDDDTMVPAGTLGRAAALAEPGALVTGLPAYRASGTLWSRLVSGFVNAHSILTYLPAARLGLTRTINGMFSLMRTDDLHARGGFVAIADEITDDYALARLFLSRSGRVIQTCLGLTIVTTVDGPGHYVALMRRWLVFAQLYVRENLSPGLIAVVLLPGLLPLPLLLTGLAAGAGWTAAALAVLTGKALLVRWLARRLGHPPGPFSDLIFEVAAELLLPLHVLAALLNRRHIRWRKRRFVLRGRRIVDG